MKKMLTFLAAGLLLSHQQTMPLTTGEVVAATEAIAAGCAATAYIIACPGSICPNYSQKSKQISCPFAYENDDTTPCYKRIQIKPGFSRPLCASALTFGAANVLFGWILSKYTPNKRYQWANKKLADFNKKYLFNQEITQENIAQILKDSGCEAQALPLVSAFLELQYFDTQLTYMIEQLNRGIDDEGFSGLSKRMAALRDRLNGYLIPIRSSEAVVKAQPQWIEQWKIHEKRMLEREKMAHQAMQSHVVWHI